MKSKPEIFKQVAKTTTAEGEFSEASPGVETPKHYRALKWYELVQRGDFVAGEHDRLELWDGPGGFRADAFVKQIWRPTKAPVGASKKSK